MAISDDLLAALRFRFSEGTAMIEEIDRLRFLNSGLEQKLAEAKRFLERREGELNDKTKVMNQYVHEDITDGYKRMRECLKEWEP